MTPSKVKVFKNNPNDPRPFNLNKTILQILGDSWTIGDACEGVQIFGGTGSGKTSGSGQTLAKSYLEHQFGGLVLTVKAGDAIMWQQYAKSMNREQDLIIVNENHLSRFNFLDYLVQQGYSTVNITHIFLSALQKNNVGDYWQNAMEQLIKNSINLMFVATGTVSLETMYKLVVDSPKTDEQIQTLFQNLNEVNNDTGSFFSDMYIRAMNNVKNHIDNLTKGDVNPEEIDRITNLVHEFQVLTSNYWISEFPQMDPEPRSSIISMFTSLADNLLRGELRPIMNCEPSEANFNPEDVIDHRKIIILDLNIKTFRETGKMAQLIFKTIFQMAVEKKREIVLGKLQELDPNNNSIEQVNQRKLEIEQEVKLLRDQMHPIFLWIDEAQFFLTKDDVMFQTTARSSKVASVYLTQNYSNYIAFVGSQREKATIDSFLAVLQTKFFHCQSDTVTNNEYVSPLIGKNYIDKRSTSIAYGDKNSTSQTTNQVLEYKIQPWQYDQLAKGGPTNDFLVEGYVYQSGRKWSETKENFGLVVFNQKI